MIKAAALCGWTRECVRGSMEDTCSSGEKQLLLLFFFPLKKKSN